MSFTKQFIPNEPITPLDADGLPESTTQDYQATFAAAIGINATGMIEVITKDLSRMISNQQRYSLDGYIQCLYRIVSHNLAWECITQAFSEQNEPVPPKIGKLFNMDSPTIKTRPKLIAE